jgi:hypothetical protein
VNDYDVCDTLLQAVFASIYFDSIYRHQLTTIAMVFAAPTRVLADHTSPSSVPALTRTVLSFWAILLVRHFNSLNDLFTETQRLINQI